MKNFAALLLLLLPALFVSGCADWQDSVNYGKWQKQQHEERMYEKKLAHDMQVEKIEDARKKHNATIFKDIMGKLTAFGLPILGMVLGWYYFLKKEAAIEHHKMENEDKQQQRKMVLDTVKELPQGERANFLASLGPQALLGAPSS